MVVYLVGFMGSGKSTVGRKLSKSLKLRFIDLDTLIESTEGKTVSEIFESKGEEYFRIVESKILRSLAGLSDIVVACGGGTPCFNDNMVYMNGSGQTVYLEMTSGALLSRLISSKKERPLIAQLDDAELGEYVSKTLEARKSWYSKARFIVNGLDIDVIQLSSLLAPDSYNP